jgi:hypothetical protein
MWTEPSSAMVAGVQGVVLAAGLYGLGYLVADALTARMGLSNEMRWALALPGLMLFALLLMGVHVVAGGRLFSSPALVRIVTLISITGLLVLRVITRRGRAIDRGVLAGALGCVAVSLLAWAPPVFQSLPLNFAPDTDLHMGWASQLLNGAPVPTSPITGPIPNFYPWLYHALVATVAPFTPTGRAFETLGALQILQVTGAALALFALGRALTRKTFTGIATVAFGAALGGLGAFVVGDLNGLGEVLRTDGTTPVAFGDVFARRTYAFPFNNLAPPLPRDLTFALLAVVAGLLAIAVTRRAVAPLVTAGVVLGLIGLTGGEAFLVGTVASLAVIVARPPGRRIASLGWFMLPVVIIYALWAGPLLIDFLDLGGFVNTTRVSAIERGPIEILASWSVAVPFALVGAAVWLPRLRVRPEAVVPLSFGAAAGTFLVVSGSIPRVLGEAFLTFGRAHRYWSLLSFGVCLYAALGATWVWDRIRLRWAAIALAAITVTIGLASPLVSAFRYTDKFPEDQAVAAALREEPDAVLDVVARQLEGRCRAAAPLNLTRQLFSYTGFKLVLWVALPERANWGRTRFADLAETQEEGFERLADNQALTLARPEPERWEQLVRSYDLDAVVAPARKSGAPAFGGREETEAGDYVVLRTGDCD